MGHRLHGLRALWPEASIVLVLLVAPFALPHIGLVPDTMNRILVFGLFGIGFDLLFGYAGMLSFGQSAFLGTGGFVAAYLLTQVGLSSVMFSLLVGTIAAAVAGYLVGLIALRRTGIYFAMITVAIAEVFFFMENSPLSSFTGGENGLPGVPAPTFNLGFTTITTTGALPMYGFLAVCYVVGIVIARRIVASPVGLVFVAIRENPLRAAAVGHNVHSYKLLAFVIAAAYAGFAGGLLGVMQGYMPPEAFAFETSGQVIMMTVIGGLATLFGPLVGAAVWLYLHDFLQAGLGLGASWRLVLGLVFVLLVCFLRRGILGGFADLYARVRGAAATAREPLDSASAPSLVAPAPGRRIPAYSGPILVAKGLTKRYGGLLANNDIDFEVHQGELRGIIGPNGAGKTTFFKMLTCEVSPTAGTIVFEGRDITGRGVTAVCQTGLTKSYQVNQLFNRLTVRQNVMISALAERRGPFRIDLLRDPARIPGLVGLVEHTLQLVELTSRADVPVSDLAYGEKRRLEIGLALATSPSLLLLDEPLAGMSPRERAETVKLLRAIGRGRTTIIVDHDMDALFELVGRVTVLQEGKILVEGSPDEIKRNPVVQEAYLGGVFGVMSLLEVADLNSYYGDSHILFDVSLRVEQNEVVALLGRNGAGKSTTLKSLMGVVRPRSGSVLLDGVEFAGRPSHALARSGMQLVHEDRRIFGSLNVEDNIVLATLTAEKPWPLDRVYEMFPRLKERRGSRGTDLSGGEQQMLAIARALVRDPKILLLDEPFEGLAPVIVRDLVRACRDLAAAGQTIVLVEQNIAATLALARRVYIINNGHVVHEGPASELKENPQVLHRYLGV